MFLISGEVIYLHLELRKEAVFLLGFCYIQASFFLVFTRGVISWASAGISVKVPNLLLFGPRPNFHHLKYMLIPPNPGFWYLHSPSASPGFCFCLGSVFNVSVSVYLPPFLSHCLPTLDPQLLEIFLSHKLSNAFTILFVVIYLQCRCFEREGLFRLSTLHTNGSSVYPCILSIQ